MRAGEHVHWTGGRASLRELQEAIWDDELATIRSLVALDQEAFLRADRQTLHYAQSGFFLRYLLDAHDGRHAAGLHAFLDAVAKANPMVLEPVVQIDVTVPQANMGDITGDLSSKRGRISGTTALAGGMVMVSGLAPLSELSSYQSELKSVTGGAGSYTLEFSHYDPVPSNIQQQLAADFQRARS